jgi:hypothetical protein
MDRRGGGGTIATICNKLYNSLMIVSAVVTIFSVLMILLPSSDYISSIGTAIGGGLLTSLTASVPNITFVSPITRNQMIALEYPTIINTVTSVHTLSSLIMSHHLWCYMGAPPTDTSLHDLFNSPSISLERNGSELQRRIILSGSLQPNRTSSLLTCPIITQFDNGLEMKLPYSKHAGITITLHEIWNSNDTNAATYRGGVMDLLRGPDTKPYSQWSLQRMIVDITAIFIDDFGATGGNNGRSGVSHVIAAAMGDTSSKVAASEMDHIRAIWKVILHVGDKLYAVHSTPTIHLHRRPVF